MSDFCFVIAIAYRVGQKSKKIRIEWLFTTKIRLICRNRWINQSKLFFCAQHPSHHSSHAGWSCFGLSSLHKFNCLSGGFTVYSCLSPIAINAKPPVRHVCHLRPLSRYTVTVWKRFIVIYKGHFTPLIIAFFYYTRLLQVMKDYQSESYYVQLDEYFYWR